MRVDRRRPGERRGLRRASAAASRGGRRIERELERVRQVGRTRGRSASTAASPTNSSIELPRVVTSGAPHASASSAGRPKPSSNDGYATTSARRNNAGRSVMAEVAGAHDAVADAARRDCIGSPHRRPIHHRRRVRAAASGCARRDARERVDEPWECSCAARSCPRTRRMAARRPPGERGEVGSFVARRARIARGRHRGGSPPPRSARCEPAAHAASRSAVCSLTHTHTDACATAVGIIRRKKMTFARSCHSGCSRNVRSCTVTTVGHVRAQRERVVRSVPHVDPELARRVVALRAAPTPAAPASDRARLRAPHSAARSIASGSRHLAGRAARGRGRRSPPRPRANSTT